MTFLVSEINSDANKLLESLSLSNREIPSYSEVLKGCLFFPLISIFCCILSNASISASFVVDGNFFITFRDELLSDGWFVFIPTAVIGFIVFILSYNNVVFFLSIPKAAREESIIISHLMRVFKRVTLIFVMLSLLSAFFSGLYPRLSFAIPAIEFIYFFVVSFFVASELNRLGAGFLLNKVSGIIKKI